MYAIDIVNDTLYAVNGQAALEEYLRNIYAVEGGEITIERSDDELVLRVAACPAVTYLRGNGHDVSPMHIETTRAVNEAICEGTPYAAELVEYDFETGRSVQRFFRRTQ